MQKVLIVDDDAITRQMIFDFIENNCFKVFQANDGFKALEIQNKEEVDLIITDLVMPVMEGLEFIVQVRSKYPDVKIIAVSGKGNFLSGSYLTMALGLGANEILNKPIDRNMLLMKIDNLLNEMILS